MPGRTVAVGESGDLFGDAPSRPGHERIVLHRMPSELRAARALCARLRDQQARPEKQRITHLICLNLISMMRHGPRA
jgi:hypothetical protein